MKKYQVFISSTYIDLKLERQAAVSAILKSGHIPAGMELFTAGDKNQWETIKGWIDESDIYMLILGGRYGSIEPVSGKCYTELEFDYALKSGKPLFSVVINDEFLQEKARENIDFAERTHYQKWLDFKKKVTSYMVSFFCDEKDIRLAVMESIPDVVYGRDLSGWVHGRNVPDVNGLINEISKLNEDNGRLKRELDLLKSKLDPGEAADRGLKKIADTLSSKTIDQNKDFEINTFNFLYIFKECANSLLHGWLLIRNPHYRKFEHETLRAAIDCFLLFELVDKEFNGVDFIYTLSKKGRELSIYIDGEYLKNQSLPFTLDEQL
ncbi:DUF4062 domain-containing protein [Serratia ureilytica]|uniref:DUF4062 domain-containing protein n=2 Tax=Serratia TaxID=613 RepID=UPI00236078AE|nr:DUF4062 domain-containing protein [Serratia ureilytica]